MVLIKTVILLLSATAAMAADAVVSGAIFVGKDTSDPSADPLEVYRNPSNHVTATSSVLVFAANTVNFHPASQEPKALIQNLDQFVGKVDTFPAFTLTQSEQFSLELDGSLTQFEKTISEQLEDPDTARALRDLVPDNVQDPSLTDWILSLVVVAKSEDSDDISVKLARVYLTISSGADAATIPKQSARLSVSGYKVNDFLFVSNAETFARRISTTRVPDFIDYLTSPKGFTRAEHGHRGPTSCFRNRQTFKDQQALLSWIL
ncbi:hypothetical protein F5H01DRAFT_339597 [Linnemannia elongata]|nr:hypothetical protein F5H01DRAFT_339597 [Linnemannia elongata]